MSSPFDWGYALSLLPALLPATIMTFSIAIAGYGLSLLVGGIAGFALTSRFAAVRTVTLGYTEFFRLTPLLVQLYFAYFVLPLIGISLPAVVTGISVLGLHYGTYVARTVRAGILATPTHQQEAIIALNLPVMQSTMRIIAPQAIRPMVPALGNFLIQLFKEVPLLSTITVYELLSTAQLFAGQNFKYLETYTMVGFIFLAISFPSALFFRRLEARRAK